MKLRHCSVCGQPGHYRRTCPQRDKSLKDAEADLARARPPRAPHEYVGVTGGPAIFGYTK